MRTSDLHVFQLLCRIMAGFCVCHSSLYRTRATHCSNCSWNIIWWGDLPMRVVDTSNVHYTADLAGRCFFCTHRSNPRSSMSCNRDRNVLRFTQPSNLSQPFFFPRLNESLSNKFVVSSTMFVNVTASLRFFAAARRAETCVSNDSSTLLLSTQLFPIDSINWCNCLSVLHRKKPLFVNLARRR